MKKPRPDDAFHALLEGEAAPTTPDARALLALTNALRPADLPAPDQRFRERLRKELLAAASAAEAEAVEAFAMAMDDPARAPAELRPLVAVAAAMEPSTRAVPSPAFRFQLRKQLVTTPAAEPLPARAAAAFQAINARMRRSLRVVAASGLAAVMLAGSSATFAAARSALPVDALYDVKRAKESFELRFRSGAPKGFVHLAHARERMREVRGMAARPVVAASPYVRALTDMDGSTLAGAEVIAEAVRANDAPRAALERVGSFARVQVQELSGLLPSLPTAALPAARDSLTVAARVARRADAILSAAIPARRRRWCRPPTLPPGPPRAGTSRSRARAKSRPGPAATTTDPPATGARRRRTTAPSRPTTTQHRRTRTIACGSPTSMGPTPTTRPRTSSTSC